MSKDQHSVRWHPTAKCNQTIFSNPFFCQFHFIHRKEWNLAYCTWYFEPQTCMVHQSRYISNTMCTNRFSIFLFFVACDDNRLKHWKSAQNLSSNWINLHWNTSACTQLLYVLKRRSPIFFRCCYCCCFSTHFITASRQTWQKNKITIG